MSARMLRTAFLAGMVLLGSFDGVGAQAGGTTANLRPGDILRVDVWPSTELSGEFTIEDTGIVYLPLLEGVQTSGVSIDALRAELRRRYAEAMRNPVVTVTPMFRVSITGAVQRPGIHMITPTHSLFDVVGLAGGFQQNAETENLRVVRDGQVIEFDALRALQTGIGMDVIQLRSGDHIVVPVRGPAILTWRNAFEAVRTLSTLVLMWDRLLR